MIYTREDLFEMREGITRKRNMIADLAIKDYNAELLSLLDEDIRLLGGCSSGKYAA